MPQLNKIDWEILNATADDAENLEQIYQSVCFEFSAENYEQRKPEAYYWRAVEGAPLLEEIADRICELVESGLLEAQLENGTIVLAATSDKSYVWRGWFRMSSQGREAWAVGAPAIELADAAKKVVAAAR